MPPNMQSTNTCRFAADDLNSSPALLRQLILKRGYCVNLITASWDLLSSLAPGGALNLTTLLSPFPSSTWATGTHTHGLLRSKKGLLLFLGGGAGPRPRLSDCAFKFRNRIALRHNIFAQFTSIT